ncbi:membrane-associated protein [Clostridium putrefaciens]|uniref:Membrane-associated protein n=1 Tax=Clostridium putrefaciens TaxID=99675 RepID=A0A381J878_9CLOT|nr:germination protein YpeB [Clostridium putrefaciens]SUY46656.1 membrane-associated protein [Clostridium putrefaciens]
MNIKNNIVKKRIIYTLLVTLIVVFSSTFAILMTLERTDYRNYLQGQYSKNIYELLTAVDNIQDNLSKSAVVDDKNQRMLIFEEIFRYSTMASDRLHSLPIPQERVNETSKFLIQVGDFCYTLVRNSVSGEEITEEQLTAIDDLSDQSYELRENLNGLLQEINEGKVKWGEIRKKATGVLPKSEEDVVGEKFQNIQKQVAQYPALIYDGPFSENILEIEPKINEEEEVSVEEAKDFLKKALVNRDIKDIKEKGSESNTKIESYGFDVTVNGRDDKENIVCDISKKGGKVIYLMDNKALNKPNIDLEKSIEIGKEYLKSLGYDNMEPTYTLKYEDNVTINYVFTVDDILVYTDQIKLKIALDNGDIIGMEADKYLVSHTKDRKIPTININADEGKKNIGKRLELKNIKLVIVPGEMNKEKLCYEYSGTYREDEYKVYVDAVSGNFERIIKIINTANGKLAI